MEDDPAYDISIDGEGYDCEQVVSSLRAAVTAALSHHGTRSATISVVVVGDPAMAELNQRHLTHDGPTDVLTFDLCDGRGGDDLAHGEASSRDALVEIDGEIIVSIETARREAEERGHTLEAELSLYVVHGVLHLLGYDDHVDVGFRRMHEAEDRVLARLGFGGVFGADVQARPSLDGESSSAVS